MYNFRGEEFYYLRKRGFDEFFELRSHNVIDCRVGIIVSFRKKFGINVSSSVAVSGDFYFRNDADASFCAIVHYFFDFCLSII